MKDIKVLFGLFLVSLILGVGGVKAISYYGITGIDLPSFSGVHTTNPQSKTKESLQYVNTIGAVDNFTGGDRAVSVQTVGSSKTSSWISAPKGSYVSWDESTANGNTKIGAYNLKLKATKSTIASVSYSGMWHLDDTYVNK